MKRDADPVTIEHIIDLRKQVERLEKVLEQEAAAFGAAVQQAYKHAVENAELKKEINDLKHLLYGDPDDTGD